MTEQFPINPDDVEGDESQEKIAQAISELRTLIESSGFVESAEMLELKAQLKSEYFFDIAGEYHKLGEAVADESCDENGQIILMLQMALIQLEAQQIDLAIENLNDALSYADNVGPEELGDQIYKIKKMI